MRQRASPQTRSATWRSGTATPSGRAFPTSEIGRINSWTPWLRLPDTHLEPAHILATTGWTTANLSNAMDAQQIDTATFDLVSLLIGVNNQYQGLPLDAYEVEFQALLNRAVGLADGREDRVFVVSIPDYGYTPFGQGNQPTISMELAQFNAACSTLTAQAGIAHHDITGISQQWNPMWVAPDGLHPSGAQYAAWVASFVDDVEHSSGIDPQGWSMTSPVASGLITMSRWSLSPYRWTCPAPLSSR